MKSDEFTRLENDAVVAGGDAAGSYLESIGKMSLAELSEPEWREFCRRLVAGYIGHLEADADQVPF